MFDHTESFFVQQLSPYGFRLLSLEDVQPATWQAWALACQQQDWPWLRDAYTDGQSLAISSLRPQLAEPLLATLLALRPQDTTGQAGRHWCIEVRYGGPETDLPELAGILGITEQQIITLHLGGSYQVSALGFLPGFAYMQGLAPSLQLPRKKSPRLTVPSGSVAMAEDMTAIYPQASSGGWWILGHTDLELFQLKPQPKALLAVGDQVEFVSC